MVRKLVLLFVLFLMPVNARAAIQTQVIEYHHGDVQLEGYLAFDDTIQGKRPGVLVVHDWTGLRDQTKKRTEQLAQLGYTAFAVDMYGKGIRPTDPKECGAQASIYKGDRPLMRERVKTGLEVLLSQTNVDASKVAAIGYCFGGTTVLELARSGADVKGVVTFHGGLDTPKPEDAKNIKGKVLVLHGADDPYAPKEQVLALEEEMRHAGVDYQVHLYGGAVHSFTIPEAGNEPSKGVAYNASADKRSWEAMKQFFSEIFQ